MLTDVRQWHANGNSSWISEAWAPFQLNEPAWGKKEMAMGLRYGSKFFSSAPQIFGSFLSNFVEVLEVQIWLFLVSNVYNLHPKVAAPVVFLIFLGLAHRSFHLNPPNWPTNLSGVHQSLRGYFTHWGSSSNMDYSWL